MTGTRGEVYVSEFNDFDECCGICGGAGGGHDCGDDSCCCLDPEPNVRCWACGEYGE